MRYLALDLGEHIGVAISDASGMVARPLEVFRRRSLEEDIAHLRALIAEHGVEAVIVGLPRNMDGTEGEQAAWVRAYSAALAEALPVPLRLWDERLTTHEAEAILRQQRRRRPRRWVDAVAAAVILQGFLDEREALE